MNPRHLHARISLAFSNSCRMRQEPGTQRVDHWPCKPRWNKRRIVCLLLPRAELRTAYPKITAMSSVEPSRLTDQLVGHKGVCPSLSSRRNAGLSGLPDDFDVTLRDIGEADSRFGDTQKDADGLTDSKQPDNRPGGWGIPGSDRQTPPQPQAPSSSLLPLSIPRDPLALPQTKESGVRDVWNKFKRYLAKRFGG